jgi:ABC-type branched-subunit amino acid transport system ATPase component/sugar phosphate permease
VTVAPPRAGALAPPSDPEHLARVHDAEVLVEDIAAERAALRDDARRTLGIEGDDSDSPPPLRRVLKDNGVTLYPLTALGILSIVDSLQQTAIGVLAPEIADTLGIGAGAIAALVGLKALAATVSTLPTAAFVQRHARRAVIIIITALGWGIATLYTGFVTSTLGLALVLVLDGVTTGSVGALHQPLLMDQYPPAARVRVLSAYRAFDGLGNVLAPLLVALLVGVMGFTWRGVLLIFGILCLAAVPYCLGLKDPGFGRWDTQALRKKVAENTGETLELDDDDVSLGFFEITRRLFLIPTFKSLLVGLSVFGVMLIPFATFLTFYLDEQLGLGPGQRGLFSGVSAAGGIVALILYGRFGEGLFRRNPGLVVSNAAVLLAAGVGTICVAVLVPIVWLSLVLFIVAQMMIAVIGPALGIAILSVVPSNMRPHVAAIQGIVIVGVGGLAGAILLGGVQNRYGTTGAIVCVAIPGVLGALLLTRASKHVQPDMDRMIDEVLENEQLRQVKAAGGHLPMLTCKGIDFAYGQLQVLFDVNFTVDDGEMVALLGTNGAGKSTLLKVISGIGLPTAGTVRYRGQDITYLDAERRARLGITQIPGGRAVFGPLTVLENLRGYGYSLDVDRKQLDRLIDDCFEAFPRLYERRGSLAAQLSGGEQQMLGLSKALIMKPRLLVIDELSLGLAPLIVGQLLDMVRRINATGTAVVLVEQSVNIALSLVEHAYFMEKGEMRFDGAAADLLARDDLLRAVFLEGSGAAK